ncbi:hypothetical protein GUJ93_ZPchr0001g31105 [Zizania palustris]|uniref:NAC domain-containing protein n=1 Tax=Zizania palustris TaxID=103762 RepID=A0A8J5RQW3_ZIZPA|nr:hypothetical protein GUJ93_ZPchr0001g31105 [Zizania palustris]
MEAADVMMIGDTLPVVLKFDPDDEELVAFYLLPRDLGFRLNGPKLTLLLPRVQRQPLPLDGIIIEDDPLSASPWELLDRHGRNDDAFFFAPAQGGSGKGGRQKRTCVGGGCWMGQKVSTTGKKLRVPVGDVETEIVWKKYMLKC